MKTVVGKLNNFIKIFAKSKCPTAASKIIHSCNLLYYYGLDSDNNLETLYEIQKQSGVKMQIMQSTEIILTKHYPCQKIIEKLAKGTKLRYYNILFNKYKYVNNEEEKKEEKDSNNHEKKPGPVPLSVCIDISLLNFNNIPIRRISNKYSVFVTGTDEELKKISPPKNVKKLTRNEVISRTFSHCILSDLVTSIHYFDLTKSKNYLILETLNVQEKETSSPLKVSFQNFGSVITKYVVKDHFNSNDCLNMNIDPKNAVQWRISELFFWNKMIPEIFK